MEWQATFFSNWEETIPASIFHPEPFSEGSCRYAYHALYTKFHSTQPHGKKAIVKKLKNFTCWKREEWDHEVKLATKAKELTENWNSLGIVNRKYETLVPEIAKVSKTCSNFSAGEWLSVEPYIEGAYVKWNSNSGWFREYELSIHSFCHWTYHYSGGTLLFCDAQGVRGDDKYFITDPAICSLVKGQYGMTDLGEAGISQWFKGHKCNTFCNGTWRRHVGAATAYAHLPVIESSTYTWQTKLI